MKRTVYESPLATVILFDGMDVLTSSAELYDEYDEPIEVGKIAF